MAVNLMVVVGILLLLQHAHYYVDFSVLRLFAMPCLALGLRGWSLRDWRFRGSGVHGADWRTGW